MENGASYVGVPTSQGLSQAIPWLKPSCIFCHCRALSGGDMETIKRMYLVLFLLKKQHIFPLPKVYLYFIHEPGTIPFPTCITWMQVTLHSYRECTFNFEKLLSFIFYSSLPIFRHFNFMYATHQGRSSPGTCWPMHTKDWLEKA